MLHNSYDIDKTLRSKTVEVGIANEILTHLILVYRLLNDLGVLYCSIDISPVK